MGQIISRGLMWTFIIATVWYFSQKYRDSSPSEAQEKAMLDAARHYQEQKARMPQATSYPPVPLTNGD